MNEAAASPPRGCSGTHPNLKKVYKATHFLLDLDVENMDPDNRQRAPGLQRVLQRQGMYIGVACAILVASLLSATAKVVMSLITIVCLTPVLSL